MYQKWLVVREEYSYKLCGILCLLQSGGTADTVILETQEQQSQSWRSLGAGSCCLLCEQDVCVSSTFLCVRMLVSVRLPAAAWCGTARTAEDLPFAKAGESNSGDHQDFASPRGRHV